MPRAGGCPQPTPVPRATRTAPRRVLRAPAAVARTALVALLALPVREAAAQTPVTFLFRSVPLASGLSDPIQIEEASDGRVFIAERTSALKVWSPATGTTTVAGTLAVSLTHEDGLLGLALDPPFASNRRLFVLYSPREAPDTLRLARFALGADGRFDAASRKDVLRIPFRRNEHSSSGLAFDSRGNLYLGIGDDSNNLSDGFPPMDERPGRSDWDAQKSAANTADLRGKILRIRPQEDGSYAIPAGNLFPPGGPANLRPRAVASRAGSAPRLHAPGARVAQPEGLASVDAFDLAGRRVWKRSLAGDGARGLRLPGPLPGPVLRFRR